MAEFLTTSGITFRLEELIKNTKSKLLLISPYLQLNERVKDYLHGLMRQKIQIRIIIRDKDHKLSTNDINWLNQEKELKINYCKNLHAKCFINEREAIITSMNLYEYSQSNNHEMGIYVTKQNDAELFNSIANEAGRLIQISEGENQKIDKHQTDDKLTGFCIRTGEKIPFNIEKPFSPKAFKEWSKYENIDYPENFCHLSGEPSHGETSFEKPILKKYWKKAQEFFGD